MSADDQLTATVGRLVGQVGHWTPPRWAASGASGVPRGDTVHELIQWLADRCADAEGRPRLPVPRLDNDLALPDQLRVVAADLARFGGPALVDEAAEKVKAVRGQL
ncbi:hypothetical protein [Dactylosporangium sp. NPDC000521]|uniref:hypothetical protein n=1 Tax=Dactylosporangium sp. NPDC000521 TaxID=3363975 RepID=UPI0036CB2BDF